MQSIPFAEYWLLVTNDSYKVEVVTCLVGAKKEKERSLNIKEEKGLEKIVIRQDPAKRD